MSDIRELLDKYQNESIAIYGIGTETERFLYENANKLPIVGLLDGFKSEGEIYGYPIISISEIRARGVKLIIVVARPGSCKVIAKRIGNFCREYNIALFDIRGRNLLDTVAIAYDFKSVSGGSKKELLKKANNADVISFDLFDTLVLRKVKSYIDVFDILDFRLRERGIFISNFTKQRLAAEKELSIDKPPTLEQIYEVVLKNVSGSFINAVELAKLEWELDFTLLAVRESVRELFKSFVSMGKKVVITTDSYYSKEQIAQILARFDFDGYDDILVSCEYGTAKTQELFLLLLDKYSRMRILHIGDDELADIEKANNYGIDTFRIYSASDLFDSLGGLGIEDEIVSVSDCVKMGLFLAHIFNNPFLFEDSNCKLSVYDASDIGYLFCSAMIIDFVLWLKRCVDQQGYEQVFFGARDGYLIHRLYNLLDDSKAAFYFYSSRTAAIRAGMYSRDDIEYVDSMKFFGSAEEAMRVRFGISVDDVGSIDRYALILERANQQRNNYHKYIDKLGVGLGKIAFFDFVAKGTVQLYIQRLFTQHMKGFYFLQLEPEFMADKGLDIESYYSEKGNSTSAIFENYYVLETILTAPFPQMEEMDCDGNPVFVKETRSGRDLKVFESIQSGIMEFFEDYIRILPKNARFENKELDEKILSLMSKVNIIDEDFLALKIEDLFFGRMTDMRDVLGY